MQKGSVVAYLAEFEDLANRVVDVPPPFLLSCFVSGLLPEIRREVQDHQPLTICQVAGLARLQEDKLSNHRPRHLALVHHLFSTLTPFDLTPFHLFSHHPHAPTHPHPSSVTPPTR